MLIQLIWFALGIATLVVGANLLVRGASKLALSFGVSLYVSQPLSEMAAIARSMARGDMSRPR